MTSMRKDIQYFGKVVKGLVKEKNREILKYFLNIFHLGEGNRLRRAQNAPEQLNSQLITFWDDNQQKNHS